MINAAVLGSPISHSLSPLLHNRAYEILGVSANYSAIEVRSGELSGFLQSHSPQEWRGFSLTMPLKEEVISLGFAVDEIARRSRSANTLCADGNSFRALSTDYLAFETLLNVSSEARIAVIGAGGTARSAVAALDEKVSTVDIFLRDPAKAAELNEIAPGIRIRANSFVELTANRFADYDWVISTVPAFATDELALALAREGADLSGHTLVEVLYNPWPTELLIAARSAGAQIVDGLDLLVEQALHQISIFTERDFDFTQMRTELLRTGLTQLKG